MNSLAPAPTFFPQRGKNKGISVTPPHLACCPCGRIRIIIIFFNIEGRQAVPSGRNRGGPPATPASHGVSARGGGTDAPRPLRQPKPRVPPGQLPAVHPGRSSPLSPPPASNKLWLPSCIDY